MADKQTWLFYLSISKTTCPTNLSISKIICPTKIYFKHWRCVSVQCLESYWTRNRRTATTIVHFSFHQVPITAKRTEAALNEKSVPHFYTWPAIRIKPQTFGSWVQCPIHFPTCSLQQGTSFLDLSKYGVNGAWVWMNLLPCISSQLCPVLIFTVMYVSEHNVGKWMNLLHRHISSHHCAKKKVTTMLTYPWKCTVLHCNHLGNTWKPLVLMT